MQWNVFVPRAVPDFDEAVALGFDDEEIAVYGHDGIDFRPCRFQSLARPDVADTGEVVGLRGF